MLEQGGALLLTADHGNADQMVDPATGEPFTAHTTNPVPLIYINPAEKNVSLRSGGRLADHRAHACWTSWAFRSPPR